MAFLAALFTVAVCWAVGSRLFFLLKVEFEEMEHALLAGVCGAALLSTTVFFLCVVHLAYAWVFGVAGVGALVLARWRRPSVRIPYLFAAVFAFYALLYLSNSLAPEMSPDGSAYHLGLVARYLTQHGFERITTNMYASLSQGTEMLFLFAFAFGGHSAAATVHCAALMTLPLLMLCYGRRVGHARAGAAAGLLVYCSPIAGIDGVSAYNDVALGLAAFTTFYLLEIWREKFDRRLLIPLGLVAGFCFAIKYTGFAAILYVSAVMLWHRRFRAFAVAAPVAACIGLPWILKNWVWLGNPVAPFFNHVFRNPYVHVTFETFYRWYFRTYDLPSYKPLFWMLTVSGRLGGQIGPLFLLLPLTLLSLRFRAGRRCLLAGLFFLIPYPQNLGARFLIPVLPFAALGIALAFEFSRAAITVLSLTAGLLAWPRVIDRYRGPAGGWQIATMPWQAALHLVQPETYLKQRYSPYNTATMINSHVPEDKVVWSTGPLAEAYIKPRVVVNYYSAEGELLEDMLVASAEQRTLRFTASGAAVRSFELTETAWDENAVWSISEARFFAAGKEIRPVSAWSSVYLWDIGLAIDGNAATRWRTWEPVRPGMKVRFDFAEPVALDRVEVETSRDQEMLRFDKQPITSDSVVDIASNGTRAMKARGIDYLLMGDDYRVAASVRADPSYWGLRLVAAEGTARLYQIQ